MKETTAKTKIIDKKRQLVKHETGHSYLNIYETVSMTYSVGKPTIFNSNDSIFNSFDKLARFRSLNIYLFHSVTEIHR